MADEAVGPADEQWQLDGGAAELYQRHLVPAVTAGWAADLVERAGLRRGERVLDVACGTGVVARAAAGRVGRAGHVAGVDINAAMLAVARSLPAGPGSGIGWLEASALGLPFRAGSYDVVLCQLGLQFVPDRPAALAGMRRVLVPGGRLRAHPADRDAAGQPAQAPRWGFRPAVGPGRHRRCRGCPAVPPGRRRPGVSPGSPRPAGQGMRPR